MKGRNPYPPGRGGSTRLDQRPVLHAWNSLASVLITDFSRIPQEQRNYVRLIFSDSTVRSRYVCHPLIDWFDTRMK
ncbi:MmyB family transcriptional regulator [Streptomyces sp. NPDC003660]